MREGGERGKDETNKTSTSAMRLVVFLGAVSPSPERLAVPPIPIT